MSNQKQKTPTTTAEKKPRKKSIPLKDKLAQLSAMADSDETVAALQPAIEAAIEAVDACKPALKRAKRRLRKLVAAAFSGTEE